MINLVIFRTNFFFKSLVQLFIIVFLFLFVELKSIYFSFYIFELWSHISEGGGAKSERVTRIPTP